MKSFKVYIIDDNPFVCELIAQHLRNIDNIEISVFGSVESCLMDTLLKPDLIILDYYLDSVCEKNMNASAALNHFYQRFQTIEIILISGKQNIAALNQHKDNTLETLVKSDNLHENLYLIVMNMLNKNHAA